MAEITIQNSRLRDIKAALVRLENPGEKVRYKFKDRAQVAYNLGKSYQAVERAEKSLDKLRSKHVQEYLEEQKLENPEAPEGELTGKHLNDFIQFYNEILEREEVLDIRQVTMEQLNLEENDIPPTVIGILLGTVIKDEN